MEKVKTVIVGGGASGLFCACSLKTDYIMIERNDRLGKKLSATGNGQGNITNEEISPSAYYSVSDSDGKIESVLARCGKYDLLDFFAERGFIVSADERGRYYPLSRQGSSITDLLRYEVDKKAKRVYTGAFVSSITPTKNGFVVCFNCDGKTEKIECENLVVATGGKSSKNFGTDGNGYNLAKSLGHTVTEIYPSLVQLKTQPGAIKGLKGIKTKVKITATANGEVVGEEYGDLIFTDYGVSGDVIFRLSAKITHKLDQKITLTVDFCPDYKEKEIVNTVKVKRANGFMPESEVLCGIVLNKIGRLILSTEKTPEKIAHKIKNYPLSVTGSLGFDYSQVSKGGVPLTQVDENLQSKKHGGLFFTGEILDCDGDCGGFNLQWAFSTSQIVAKKINNG